MKVKVLIMGLLWPLLLGSTVLVAQEKDTLLVDLGKGNEVIFYLNKNEGIKQLMYYDLNAIIDRAIKVAREDDNRSNRTMKIEDRVSIDGVESPSTDTNLRGRASTDEPRRLTEDLDPVADAEDESQIAEREVKEKATWKEGSSDKNWDQKKDDPLIITPKSSANRIKRIESSFNLELGLNNYVGPDGFPDQNNELFALSPFGSRFVALAATTRFRVGRMSNSPVAIEWTKSFSWHNYRFAEASTRMRSGSEGVEFFTSLDDVSHRRSKFVVPHLNMSLIPVVQIAGPYGRKTWSSSNNRGLVVGAGPFIGYRTGGYTMARFRDGGRQRDRQSGNFFLNNWRYGVRGKVSYRNWDFFFDYDMNSVFHENRGPDLVPFTFGIII
ncbi:MAG: hypothetical protein LAT68_02335 [Cyclobacteriaceae bacterium]|nr:hypothetical protein [Cyclobacteriaceae bacterium]MCH8515142.1 hypothetical protein [Cyclobacteriaceae bacterium]